MSSSFCFDRRFLKALASARAAVTDVRNDAFDVFGYIPSAEAALLVWLETDSARVLDGLREHEARRVREHFVAVYQHESELLAASQREQSEKTSA